MLQILQLTFGAVSNIFSLFSQTVSVLRDYAKATRIIVFSDKFSEALTAEGFTFIQN